MKRYGIYGCSNPECSFGYNLEVHHIIPVAKGGKDEYENYIILCLRCHRGKGNHKNYKQRLVILWTYKFYFESKADANLKFTKENKKILSGRCPVCGREFVSRDALEMNDLHCRK